MSAPELVIGSVIAGKYTIRSLLLRGGPTATYRAVAPKNREVVLKVYDPAILSFPELLKTLAQHKSIGAKLPAHQVVAIAESGTDPNSGAPFTVSDFESVPSLAQLIDRGPLSASAMVTLIRNLASTIDLLHSSGIASLSLHPGNVFVRPGDPYEVRVADFGGSLVRRTLPAPEKAGRWMPWLAPEQIKGQDAPTRAADIFALGLLAFFAVTGKSYWRSSQQKVPDTTALRREVLGERMPASVRASEFSITLNPAVDAVFARALAFRPNDRHATAQEFAAGLEAALSGRSAVEADAAPTAQRMAAPAPRKMPQRATMLGMGSPATENPTGASATTGGPRPPMSTMLGMGEAAAAAVAAAPAIVPAPPPATTPAKITPPPMPTAAAKAAPAAKASAPAMTPAPAKAAPPAMTAAPAKTATPPVTATAPKAPPPAKALPAAVFAAPVIAVAPATSPTPATRATTATSAAPAMPVARAMPVESPMVVPSETPAPRAGPPPLPMAPPPDQLEEVLAQFEAGAPDLRPRAPSPTPSTAGADVVQTPPAWSTAQHGDTGERVETGVAVVGAVTAHTPRNIRMRWVASICGLLVLIGGAAVALSSGTSGSDGPAASEAKATATATAKAPSISAESPSAAVQAPSPNAMQQGAEEPPPSAAPEPSAVAPPGPPPEEPEAAEPSRPTAADPVAPIADSNADTPSGKSGPSTTWTPPAGTQTQPSKKPCGKFLKRCD